MQRHIEREKMEMELFKIVLKETRFNKNQIWKVGYYGIIVYAGIISVINIFKDKLPAEFSWLAMYYYMLILLTASISLRITNILYHNIFASRNLFMKQAGITSTPGSKYKESFTVYHVENEQFIAIIFITILGYVLSILYVFSIYGFNRGIYLALPTYIVLEGLITFHRRKSKHLVTEDISRNLLLLSALYFIYIVLKDNILLIEFSRSLNKPF